MKNRVAGDDEHGLADADGDDGAADGLADAAHDTDEDPLEGVLLQVVPHLRVRHVADLHHRRGRHRVAPPIPRGCRSGWEGRVAPD